MPGTFPCKIEEHRLAPDASIDPVKDLRDYYEVRRAHPGETLIGIRQPDGHLVFLTDGQYAQVHAMN